MVDGVFVVAGGDAAPLLVVVEGRLDDVAALVGDRVEAGWGSADWAAEYTVAVCALRDHGLDATSAEQRSSASRGVGCVTKDRGRVR